MRNNILLGLLIVCFMASCASDATQNNTTDAPLNQFGEVISQEGSISYDELLATLSEKDSIETKVTGTVSAVCKKKGCWMTIVSDDSDTEMRVKFKDYGFFVPKDIEGRTVVFEGKAYKDLTSVDELRHYAEDEGKSKEEIEAINEPQEDYNFLASGVLLLDK